MMDNVSERYIMLLDGHLLLLDVNRFGIRTHLDARRLRANVIVIDCEWPDWM